MKTAAARKAFPLHVVSVTKGKPSPATIEAGIVALDEIVSDLKEEINEGGWTIDAWANEKTVAGVQAVRDLLDGRGAFPTPLEVDGALVIIEKKLKSLEEMRDKTEASMGGWGICRRLAGLEEAKRRLIEYDANTKREYLAERKRAS